MTIPSSTVESAILKIFRDEGWNITSNLAVEGGVKGICSQNIDGKIFAWPFSLNGMDMVKSPMEIITKMDSLRAAAVSHMCSGISI